MSHEYESFHKILISRNEIDFDGGDFIGIGRIQAKAENDKGESSKNTWQFKLGPSHIRNACTDPMESIEAPFFVPESFITYCSVLKSCLSYFTRGHTNFTWGHAIISCFAMNHRL